MLYLCLFAIIVLVVTILGLRRRVLFRMGARNFIRHRTHSALVIGGLLIGTAIMSGAMVTGDCIDNFIVKSTYESLDLVDVTVKSNQSISPYFNQSIFWEIHDNTTVQKYTDGIAPMLTVNIAAENANANRSEPSITLMGFNATLDRSFGSFTKTDGGTTYGTDLKPSEIILNADAADKLKANVGQSITISYQPKGSFFPSQSSFNVSCIIKYEGKGRYNLVPAIFIRLDVAQKLFNVPNEINLIKISGIGDMKTGIDYSDNIVKAVNQTLAISKVHDSAGHSAKQLVIVTPEKKESIELSRQLGEMITMFITIFGSFSIIAGIILIINIFTMLAEERKSELGMARAVGMTRKDLMQMFLFEGTTYTIFAAAIGTFAGLLIAYGLMWGVNNVFSTFVTGGIPFSFEWTSLLNAFCMGAIITFLTIIVASWRVTNINIVRAIRDIEDPIPLKGSRVSVVLGGFLAVIMLILYIKGYDNLIIRYVVLCIAIMGVALVIRGFTSARIAFTASGAGIMIYTLYSITTFFKGGQNDLNIQYLFIVAGIFIVLAAVIIVMFNSSVVVGIVSGTIGRTRSMRPVVKTAIAHPLNKRFRTGMTIAMFSLVIFTIVMVSVFTGIFSINSDEIVAKQGGGYQIMGSTNMPVQDIYHASIYDPQNNITIPINSPTLKRDIMECQQITIVIPTPEMKIVNQTTSGSGMGFGSNSITVYAVDSDFTKHNPDTRNNTGFSFSNYSQDYSSPSDVWKAVSAPNSTKIVYGSMSFGGTSQIELGSVVNMNTTTGWKKFTVIGVLDTLLSGVFVTKSNAQSMFFAPYSGNYVFLFKVKVGLDIQKVADNLKWDFRMLGMNATNLRATIELVFNMINSIFLLFEVFLGLGLIVGIAGLGIITIRSVVERKREIGIMRAIGFERRKILASQITEILFIATLAVIIGVAVGLVVTYEIFTNMVSGVGVTFKIPWVQIGWVMLITYVASLACTIIPAIRASRLPPAEALRIME